MAGVGDNQALSAELLQNLQTAVGSSGVIGQVQVIETENGPMTVIFMEEGAEAAGGSTVDISSTGVTQETVGGEQYQYAVVSDGETYTTQVLDTGQESVAESSIVTSTVAMDAGNVNATANQAGIESDTYYITDTGEIIKIEAGSVITDGQIPQQTVIQTVDDNQLSQTVESSQLPDTVAECQTVESDSFNQLASVSQIPEQSSTVLSSLEDLDQSVVPSETIASGALSASAAALDQPTVHFSTSQLTQDQAVMETIDALNQLQQEPPLLPPVCVSEQSLASYLTSTIPSTVGAGSGLMSEYTAVKIDSSTSATQPYSLIQQKARGNIVSKPANTARSQVYSMLSGTTSTKMGTSQVTGQSKSNYGTFRVKKIGGQTVLEPVNEPMKKTVSTVSYTSKPIARNTLPAQGNKKSLLTKQPVAQRPLQPATSSYTRQLLSKPIQAATTVPQVAKPYSYSYVGAKSKIIKHEPVIASSNVQSSKNVVTTQVKQKVVGVNQSNILGGNTTAKPEKTIQTKQFITKVPEKDRFVEIADMSKGTQPTTSMSLKDAADLLSSAMQEAEMQLEESNGNEIQPMKEENPVETVAQPLTDTLEDFLTEPPVSSTSNEQSASTGGNSVAVGTEESFFNEDQDTVSISQSFVWRFKSK